MRHSSTDWSGDARMALSADAQRIVAVSSTDSPKDLSLYTRPALDVCAVGKKHQEVILSVCCIEDLMIASGDKIGNIATWDAHTLEFWGSLRIKRNEDGNGEQGKRLSFTLRTRVFRARVPCMHSMPRAR